MFRIHVCILLCSFVTIVPAGESVAPEVALERPGDVPDDASLFAVPRMLSYQGRLFDSSGQPVPDTVYPVTFRFYTQQTGGVHIWHESRSIRTDDGLFSALLGSSTPIESVPRGGVLYLGMRVGADPEMAPRTLIASAAYAYAARNADTAMYVDGARPIGTAGGDLSGSYPNPSIGSGAVSTAKIQNGAVTGSKLNRSGAATGQVLKWTGSSWAPANDSIGGSGSIPDSVPGDFAIGGDLRVYGKGRIGLESVNPGNHAFAAGHSNQANGAYSSAVGGTGNRALANYASVSGGWQNTAGGQYSGVSGGGDNTAGGWLSSVAGGFQNTAGDTGAAVGGGDNNSAAGKYATVGGGQSNDADSAFGTIAGGDRNRVWGDYGAVCGGVGNVASYGSFVAGGRDNGTFSNSYCAVGGGRLNRTEDGSYSTIAGGHDNGINAEYGAVGGGGSNFIDSANATISGGVLNYANGRGVSIGGGRENRCEAGWAAIGGGKGNVVRGGEYAAISGGDSCRADGRFAAVGGGSRNSAGNTGSTVGGGESNNAAGLQSTVSGGGGNRASGREAAVGGGAGNRALDRGCTVAGGGYNTADGTYSLVGGGLANSVDAEAATVLGGRYDTCEARVGLVAGERVRARSGAQLTFAFGRDFETSTGNAVVFCHGDSVTKLGVGVANPTRRIDVRGGAYCTGTQWVNASAPDDRTDVRTVTEAEAVDMLAELARTGVVRYRLRGESTGEEHIGLVGDEAPELVATPGRDGISTGDAIGFLFAALKAQTERVGRLEARLAELERR